MQVGVLVTCNLLNFCSDAHIDVQWVSDQMTQMSVTENMAVRTSRSHTPGAVWTSSPVSIHKAVWRSTVDAHICVNIYYQYSWKCEHLSSTHDNVNIYGPYTGQW